MKYDSESNYLVFFCSDRKSAEQVLTTIADAGLTPNSNTYANLFCMYAMENDITSILVGRDNLLDEDIFKVIDTLLKNGHDPKIDAFLENVKISGKVHTKAINFIYHLLNQGHDSAALEILSKLKDKSVYGHFLIRHLVKLRRPPNDIFAMCDSLEVMGLTKRSKHVLLHAIIQTTSLDEALQFFRDHRTKFEPITQDNFQPFFENVDANKTLMVVQVMTDEFQIKPNAQFTREVIGPNLDIKNPEQTVYDLRSANIPIYAAGQSVFYHCLSAKRLSDAADIANQFYMKLHPNHFIKVLIPALVATGDFKSYVSILRNFHDNFKELEERIGESSESDDNCVCFRYDG